MSGQATAALAPVPRRWVQRLWGHPYVQQRQDWSILWPALAQLPRRGIRLLDAGCGTGHWSLELAARRPGWFVVGLDRCRQALAVAEQARQRLGLANASFLQADFAEFRTRPAFDVVLSVCSAHYAVRDGTGQSAFEGFRACLKPGGHLVLYTSRMRCEAPFVTWLPRWSWHDVCSADQLVRLCADSALDVEYLGGRIGRLGTAAKQLDQIASGGWRRLMLASGLYAIQLALASLDLRWGDTGNRRSLMWLLVARARAAEGEAP
jgi:SAM-dependent methyltransferase